MAGPEKSIWEQLEASISRDTPESPATVGKHKMSKVIGKPIKNVLRNDVDARIDDIVNILADYRIQYGLSYNELARRIGTSASNISSVEKRDVGLTVKRMLKYADALGLKTTISFEPLPRYYDTLELLERIPEEPRDLIRRFISNRKDALLIDDRNALARQKIIDSCESAIRGLLSLYIQGEELEKTYRLLVQ